MSVVTVGSRTVRWAMLTCLLALGILVSRGAPAFAAQASWQGPGYEETPIPSTGTGPAATEVSESYASIAAPLPAGDGPVPAACERIGYLRWRASDGPASPDAADAIFVAQPGVIEGAGAFNQVARNTIVDALAQGYHIEFWAISRRSNCLIDPAGVQAAIRAHDPQLAYNYYFDGAPVDGHTFPGVVTPRSAEWLSHVGLAQTVEDEYSIIRQLSPAVRRTKVMCGGHSLGGVITGAFANWDFSGHGDPAMAGYNQCAGYFSLESRFEFTPASTQLAVPWAGLLGGVTGGLSRAMPYIDVPPVTPQTEYLLPILGMASAWSPDARSTFLSELPDTFNFNFTEDFLLADSYQDLLNDGTDGRTLNATNQAVVGDVFSADTESLSFLRTGLGAPTGGPLVERNFPVPYDSGPVLKGFAGGEPQVAIDPPDATASGPLYRWLNDNQITQPLSLPSDPTLPYATPTDSVTDITQFSQNLFESAPALFTEPYFPTRLALDSVAIGAGDRAGSLSGLRYTDGISMHPAVYVDGGEGLSKVLDPGNTLIEPSPAPLVHVVVPGYHHLDVLTADAQQNNGQPEQTTATLTSWMEQVVGPPAP